MKPLDTPKLRLIQQKLGCLMLSFDPATFFDMESIRRFFEDSTSAQKVRLVDELQASLAASSAEPRPALWRRSYRWLQQLYLRQLSAQLQKSPKSSVQELLNRTVFSSTAAFFLFGCYALLVSFCALHTLFGDTQYFLRSLVGLSVGLSVIAYGLLAQLYAWALTSIQPYTASDDRCMTVIRRSLEHFRETEAVPGAVEVSVLLQLVGVVGFPMLFAIVLSTLAFPIFTTALQMVLPKLPTTATAMSLGGMLLPCIFFLTVAQVKYWQLRRVERNSNCVRDILRLSAGAKSSWWQLSKEIFVRHFELKAFEDGQCQLQRLFEASEFEAHQLRRAYLSSTELRAYDILRTYICEQRALCPADLTLLEFYLTLHNPKYFQPLGSILYAIDRTSTFQPDATDALASRLAEPAPLLLSAEVVVDVKPSPIAVS